MNARDVEGYLDDFLEGRGGDWDWDDFTSIPITDAALESVRQEAARVEYPPTEEGRERLRELLERVQAM